MKSTVRPFPNSSKIWRVFFTLIFFRYLAYLEYGTPIAKKSGCGSIDPVILVTAANWKGIKSVIQSRS